MVQEGVGRDGKNDHVAAPLDPDVMHQLDGRLGLALGGAKGREIVPAEQRLHRLPHQFDVERAEEEAGAPFHQRRTGRIVVQHIVIGARAGAEAGVKEIIDGRIARQFLAQRTAIEAGRKAFTPRTQEWMSRLQGGIEMHDLLQRMHAGIGAAGAGGGQAHAGKFLQRVFQLVLHRQAAFLLLVAMPGQPVILQAQDDALQWRCFVSILHRRIIPACKINLTVPSSCWLWRPVPRCRP